MEYIIVVYDNKKKLYYSRGGYFCHDRKATKGWRFNDFSQALRKAGDLEDFLSLNSHVVVDLK